MIPPPPPAFDDSLPTEIDALIRGPQYALPQAAKEQRLFPLLRRLCLRAAERCPPRERFLQRLGNDPAEWSSSAAIPPLPVSVFKRHFLATVPREQIVRELRSSATTGQHPSRIAVDKATAFRQARALASILKDHIGGTRRPLLVLDAPESASAGESLTARGAAIRGIGQFASDTVYAMRSASDGGLEPDWQAIDGFFRRWAGQPVLLFGFTFVVWTRFIAAAQSEGKSYPSPDALLLHSGGWKKLTDQAVSKETLSARAAEVLQCSPAQVLDFYGMVEQVGTVFVDCAAGHKHAPSFADVILRRAGSLAPAAIGETGIVEVLSALPTSYPGQALITEDEAVLRGVDDCPCGRKGVYFQFLKRIERAEIRGCGDVAAQSREIR